MAVEPAHSLVEAESLIATPFSPTMADDVASWIHGSRAAYWLAPRTCPPITAEKIRAWIQPGCCPMTLVTPESAAPVAYGEINPMPSSGSEYWLGHLIVDPAARGRGVGRRLAAVLLARAFSRLGAQRVSLVVFPDNQAAIACYRAAGMNEDGYESHGFPAYKRRERLVRLAATRDAFCAGA